MPSEPKFNTANVKPPKAVLDYLARKKLRTAWSWADVWRDEHTAAFTVAKMMDRDMLHDVKLAVDKAIESGETFAKFKKNLRETLARKGWGNTFESIDPVTGEVKSIQLSDYRLKRIYDTNVRQSYHVGKWAQIERTKKLLPYIQYRLGPSVNHREAHLSWNMLVLHADDPFWDTHTPMNGFGCKCWLKQLTKKQAEAAGISKTPKIDYQDWVNPRTGVSMKVPKGVTPGFDYNVGKMRQPALDAQLRAKAMATDAFASVAGEFTLPYRLQLYRNWLEKAKNQAEIKGDKTLVVPRKERISIGYLPPELDKPLAAAGIYSTGVLVLTDNMVVGTKIVEKHKKLGNQISDADMADLPLLLMTPHSLWLDKKANQLIQFVKSKDGQLIKIVYSTQFSSFSTRTMFYITDDGYKAFAGRPENRQLK